MSITDTCKQCQTCSDPPPRNVFTSKRTAGHHIIRMTQTYFKNMQQPHMLATIRKK